MLILKDVIKDIKKDYKHAKDNIDKAMKYKLSNPTLAEEYYTRSVTDLNNGDNLHDDIASIINKYRKEKGEPPQVMTSIYDYEHDNMIDEVTEIKQLQDYYKSL